MSSPASRVRTFATRTLTALRASWSEAFGDDRSVRLRERRTIGALIVVAAATFFVLAWERYATFHNRNFDLAFYARLAWGESHLDVWEPIVDAHVYGLHFVWVFEVLTWLGVVLGQVRVLLAAQSLAVALAAWPLARIGARRLGPWGAYAAALGWLVHPNLSHVATNDFHPGTLAVLPLAWGLEALERKNVHGLAWSALGVLACREDLGLVVVLYGLFFALWRCRGDAWTKAPRTPAPRTIGLAVAALAFAYVAFFVGYFHARYAPPHGSFALHFGHWGSSTGEMLRTVLTHPRDVFAWLSAEERAPYPLLVLAPLAFLALLAPEWLALAAPILATNLLSAFPTTLFLDSHYLTPAVPILVAASLVGASRLAARIDALGAGGARTVGASMLASALAAQLVAGGLPGAAHFDAVAYAEGPRTAGIARDLESIPAGASVQAPERMLAHFAERRTLTRPPPPEMNTDFVVIDAWVRRLHRHHEGLLRTDEEPVLRDWLARTDHALVAAEGDVLVLARGRSPRESIARQAYVVGHADASEGRSLTACLGLLDAELVPRASGADLVLTFGARGPCPSDLALRIGWGYRPRRVDLIADGLLSPALFEAGDRIRSVHALSAAELADVDRHGLRVGAIRASGARPDHGDPAALDVPLETPNF